MKIDTFPAATKDDVSRAIDAAEGTFWKWNDLGSKEIESNKTKLIRLVEDGIDILATGSFRKLAVKIIEIKKDALKSYINQIKERADKDKITVDNLREKLKLAGEFGAQIADILDLNPL